MTDSIEKAGIELPPLLPTSPNPGEVWLVGAGPGDPGLMALAGWQALAHATAVVHDRLGCEDILPHIPPGVLLADAGKSPGHETVSQEEINHRLAELARAGHCVVRLKGGDPFVFGRGREEMDYLRERGVPCHLVPGISSALAGPAALGMPVTHRQLAHGFAVATGHTAEGIPAASDRAPMLTHVFLMGMKNLGTIVESLRAQGLRDGTPAVVVAWATSYRQRSLRATLGTLVESARASGLRPPAIVAVGEAAALALEGNMAPEPVLVTASRVPGWFGRVFPGARPLWRPLQRPVARAWSAAERTEALELLHGADLLILHGSQPVRALLSFWREAGEDLRRLPGELAAVGEEAAEALRQAGLLPDLILGAPNMEEVGQQLAGIVKGKIAVLPGGEGSGHSMRALAERHGAARATPLPLFRQEPLSPRAPDWVAVRRVLLSSPTGVRRFREAFSDAPIADLRAHCLGPATVGAAGKAGFVHVEDIAAQVSP